MQQAALDLSPLPADPCDRVGFEIGWDHARHALVPPAGLLLDGTPVCQGWMAGKAVFGPRTLAATRPVRLALQLRIDAWRQGIDFETHQVTPHYLAQLHTEHCPVTRLPLGGAAGDAQAAVVERLNPQAGYAAGNLATLSLRAAQARAGQGVADAVRRARNAESAAAAAATRGDAPSTDTADAALWWRLAALAAFATPLPFYEAARLPLAVLPPNRVRLLNAAQALQALVTRLFLSPGWSARCRAIGALLPAHTLRHDFNLFVGALAPRVLEAAPDPRSLRRALEDAWLNERVQRRWQHFVLSLGETATEALLQRAATENLAGVRTLTHAPEQAVEGWGLPAAASAPAAAMTVPRAVAGRPLPAPRRRRPMQMPSPGARA